MKKFLEWLGCWPKSQRKNNGELSLLRFQGEQPVGGRGSVPVISKFLPAQPPSKGCATRKGVARTEPRPPMAHLGGIEPLESRIAPSPVISISSVALYEGNSGKTTFHFTVTLSEASRQDVTVDYATVDGTATASSGDYDAIAKTTLTIPAGSLSAGIDVSVNGDTILEQNETFSVKLSNPVHAALNSDATLSTGKGTILNDDAPNISIGSAAITEGDLGTKSLVFVVELSAPTNQTVYVNCSTSDGSALHGVDYTATTKTVQIAAGSTTSDPFEVPIIGNLSIQPNRNFSVDLSNASFGTITSGHATGTIIDDDTPSLTVSDVSIAEGNDPNHTTDAVFTVNLSKAIADTVSLDWSTADGTAHSGTDYYASSGPLTIPGAPGGGSTSATFVVPIIGNTLVEPNKTFVVNFSNLSNATMAKTQATGTILNDDAPNLSINNVSLVEGNTGTQYAVFTVSLSQPMTNDVTFHWATADGTAFSSGDSPDYAAASGTITIPGTLTDPHGSLSATISVVVNGDKIKESNENFFVNLSDVTNANLIQSQGVGTIIDDDAATVVNSHTLTYTDVDGDLVTIKSSKGGFGPDPSQYASFISTSDGHYQLESLTLNSAFKGTDLTFSATPTQGAGDGHVNVGYINATGVDLGKITIPGDLAKIDAGDNSSATGIAGLQVDSIGKQGLGTGASDLTSTIRGSVGAIKVLGDFDQATLNILGTSSNFAAGSIGTLSIGGKLAGGDAKSSGLIYFTGNLGTAEIGSIQGGAGQFSGDLYGETNYLHGNIGKITLHGDLLGGAGANSGMIYGGAISSAIIQGNIQGGAGTYSGEISASALSSALIGVSGSNTGGSILGGAGANSGSINNSGNLGTVKILHDLRGGDGSDSGQIQSSGKLASATILGSVVGGAGSESGSIQGTQALGTVIVDGDLQGGAGSYSGEIFSATNAGAVSILGSVVGGDGEFSGGIASSLNLGSIKIGHGLVGDIVGGTHFGAGSIYASGKIGSVAVAGSLEGGDGDNTGTIFSGADPGLPGTLGKVTIGSNIVGGHGANSGQINTGGDLLQLSVAGSLQGNSGDSSGAILSAGSLGVIRVAGDVQGGTGSGSGAINSGFNIGSVLIGRSLIGSDGAGSGAITSHTVFGPDLDSQGDIGMVKISGTIAGGAGLASGQINAAGNLGKVSVGQSLVGGSGTGSGCILSGTDAITSGAIGSIVIGGDLVGGSVWGSNSLDQSGFISGEQIAKISIGGSVISGTNYGSGTLTKSGSIRSEDNIGALSVGGSLEGNASNPAVISARGQAVPGKSTDLAIGSLTVGATVEYANILAGYDTDLNPINGSAQIGAIKVLNTAGNGSRPAIAWTASSVVAGIADAGFDGFGSADNAIISSKSSPGILSTIASIQIAGDIAGTDQSGDHFGFVAQQIGSFKFGNTVIALHPTGAPDVVDPLGTTSDVSLREIAG